MMGRIGQQEREDFTDFVELLINKDENKIVDALLKLTNYAEDPNRSELQRDLMEFIDRYAYLPLKKLEIAKMLQSVLEILTKQGMSLKPDLYLMIKALSIAEGLGRSLDPEFEIVNHAKPFFRKIKASRYTPKRIAGDLVDSGTELLRLFKEIPGEVREVLKNVRDGKLKIEIEYQSSGSDSLPARPHQRPHRVGDRARIFNRRFIDYHPFQDSSELARYAGYRPCGLPDCGGYGV